MRNKVILEILLILACFFLAACSNWFTPIESDPKTKTESLSLQDEISPPSDSTASLNPLPDFPLSLGTTRIYTASHYDTLLVEGKIDSDIESYFYITETHGLKVITATYLITETVTNVQPIDTVYAVDIFREQTVISSTVDFDNLDWEHISYLDGRGGKSTYTYVISGTNVFKESDPDIEKLDLDHYLLEFIFPLQNYATWFPSWDQRIGLTQMTTGHRFVEGPLEVNVPGGNFNDCFIVVTTGHAGPSILWFCNGIGIVKEKYDHRGTPSGHETVLISHNIE